MLAPMIGAYMVASQWEFYISFWLYIEPGSPVIHPDLKQKEIFNIKMKQNNLSFQMACVLVGHFTSQITYA